MKRKMVTALLCSMVIATSAAGSAAAVSADTEAVMTEAVEMHRGFGGQGQENRGGMPGGEFGGQGQEDRGGMPGGEFGGQGQEDRGSMPGGEFGGQGQQGAPEGQQQNGQQQNGQQQNGQQGASNGRQGQMPGRAPEMGSNGATVGKVTAIDGNKVTVSVLKDGKEESVTYDLSDVEITKAQGGPMMSRVGNQTPPEKPEGESAGSEQQTPPEKPEGESADSAQQTPSEKPESESADSAQQTPPEKPEGESADGAQQGEKAAVSDISAGDLIEIALDESGNVKSVTLRQKPDRRGQVGPSAQNGSAAGAKMSMSTDGNTENGEVSTSTEKPEGESDNGEQQTPTEKPEGESDNGEQQTPTEKPEGESDNGEQQTPPEKPEGESNNGEQQAPPEKPNGEAPSGEMPNGEMPGGMPGGQGGPGGSAPTEYAAASALTENASGETYTSSAEGESAVLVDGKEVSISDITVEKTGDSSGEDSDFYGTNAAVLAVNGGHLVIDGANITTDGTHANAVFSYGEGTTVDVSDATITTTGNNSGGIMTTGGATMNAENLTVNTSGNSSASIRSDRGGGTVTVSKGSYNTSGVGSPAIYSTADITVSDAALSATNSEAVVIEGGNSVTLNNVNANGNNATLNGQSTIKTNVLIYQSMSGDASEGKSAFSMTGGSMTCETGTMFHVTNTTTTIDLSGVAFTYADDSDDFIVISEDSWGNAGSNGGHVTMNLDAQTVEGNAVVDQSSDLTMTLANASSYTGAVNSDNSGAEISVSVSADSTWTLTGDSYISSFDGDLSSVNTNGYHLYVNGELAA